MSILDISGLEVRRGGRVLVRDVTWAASRGERVALMGASGAGKTTVLRAIAGLDRPSAGSISIDGVRIAAGDTGRTRDLHRRVGLVFQFHHLFAHMTALQNVCLAPVHVLGQPRPEAERRAHSLLDRLGVAGRAHAQPHELSGGEAQRVAIARALAVDPPVLLMDEPTASLDPARRDELAATLRQLAEDGTIVIVATHDVEFARSCVERVIVMADGRVVGDGSMRERLS